MLNDSQARQKTGERPYPRHCPHCAADAVAAVSIPHDAEIKHDGKLHCFHIRKLAADKCQNCGEIYFTNQTDDSIRAELRSSLGLLQPDEIRRRLAELELSQRAFADGLGVAQETVSRWVNGQLIQTRAMDNLMRVFFAFGVVRNSLLPHGPASSLGVTSTTANAS